MLPIRTERSSFVYRSSNDEVVDMPGERVEPGRVRSVWTLTEEERADISHGLNIELNFFAEPIPPVSLEVTYEGATLHTRRPLVVAERFMGEDGRWYVRLLSEYGATLGLSKGYSRRWRARLAQRQLKNVLPELDMWPS